MQPAATSDRERKKKKTFPVDKPPHRVLVKAKCKNTKKLWIQNWFKSTPQTHFEVNELCSRSTFINLFYCFTFLQRVLLPPNLPLCRLLSIYLYLPLPISHVWFTILLHCSHPVRVMESYPSCHQRGSAKAAQGNWRWRQSDVIGRPRCCSALPWDRSAPEIHLLSGRLSAASQHINPAIPVADTQLISHEVSRMQTTCCICWSPPQPTENTQTQNIKPNPVWRHSRGHNYRADSSALCADESLREF